MAEIAATATVSLASRLSGLLLLVTGLIVGPLSGLLHPGELLGKLLFPMVSLAVAVILYEGGMNLRFRELRKQNIVGIFLRIGTVAAFVSLVISTVAARYIMGFRWPVASLPGAILVVTGPTVIGPMLRHLRLRGRVGSLLKWEGIVVDPLGAILAVLVFTVARNGEFQNGLLQAAIVLFIINPNGVIQICTAEESPANMEGDLIISLVPDADRNPPNNYLDLGQPCG